MITHYTLTKLHSQARMTALMLLMFLSIESSVGQAKSAAPGTGGEQEVESGEYIGPLELGKPVERELAGNAIHVYSLSLVAGQFVNVIVEQRGIDVVVVLIAPDGKKTIEVDSPNGTYGTEPLMSVAEVAGPYKLEVRSLEKSAPRGRYVVTLAQLRDGTAADKALVSELGEATRLGDQVSKLSATGKFKDAIPLAERLLLIKEKAFGAEHIDVATASNELAKLYQAQGNYARAEKAYRRALEIRERTFGAEHQDVAATLNNLGTLYYFKGDYGRAEESYQRALRIRERVFDPNDSRIATTLSNLAALYEVKGDYARSELMYQRALTIYQTALGPEHPFVGATLNNLGVLYKGIGDYVRAEPLYLRALEIREKALGPVHPDVAETLNNLAVIYRDRGQPERAEPLYVRALAIEEKVLGPEHPYVALILSNLAVIYDDREDYARAEEAYLRAIAIYEKTHGPEHPELASILVNLAEQYRVRGDYTHAEPIYRRALAITEKAFGPEYPLVADVLHNFAALDLDRENYAEAIKVLTRRDDIRERTLALLLPIGSEEQKRRFLQRVSSETDGTVSLHVRYAPNNAQATELALTTVLRRKGRVLDAMSDSFGALRLRLNTEDRVVLDQLFTAYSQYAALADKGLGSGAPAERRAAAAEIRSRIEQLEALVSRSSAAFRTQNQPTTLTGVQRALPKGTALVEVVLFRPLNVKAKTKAERYGRARYVAYVLHGAGPPAWADLGEAEVIDRAAAELRQILNDPRLPAKRLARALDEKLMRPVRGLLGDTRRVFLSPDGALNLLPFGALVDERGKYLIENYSFTYLTSGRDLLRLKTSEGGESASILVADPAFDVAVTTANASAPSRNTAQERRSADLKGVQLAPLPGTREEVERIKALLPKVQVLLGAEATESATKQVAHPSILHIATHGFFLENETARPDAENPLLRSGLLLAGANKRQSGPGEDGVLTALEVAGLDLWGTKLVVLSACETGLGDVKNGEGVYGLRRALVLAGSETQVMSLWKVSDAGTRDLMTSYYQRLQTGAERAEALRQVQLIMLRGQLKPTGGGKKRATTDTGEAVLTKDYSHPYYWASFIQSGDWRSLNGK